MSPETETVSETTPLVERKALSELSVEHLCDARVDLEPAQVVGMPIGTRLVYIVKGGSVEGPRLNGEILPGGGDWLLIGDDRIGRVDVYATLRTDDGALIDYRAGGVIKVPDDGLQRLAAGERLPFEETYVRTTPKLETADERYSWINGLTVVTHSELSANHVDHRMYAVH
jgi:hypothetical protein